MDLRRTAWTSAFAVALLGGCAEDGKPTFNDPATDGSSPTASSGDSDASSSGASSASDSDGSGTSSGPSSTTGDETSGESTANETSGTTGSDPEPDYATPYFPLQVGLQWTYRLTRTSGELGTDCDNRGDEHVMSVTDFDAGTGVYTRTEDPSCYFASLSFRVEGDYIDVDNSAWYHHLLLPPELDATWAAGGASGATYIWDEHFDTYTVEAGTFDDCWRRKQQGYEVWEVYCRNVGAVESHYAAWGGDTRSELVDFVPN
jgi:hypothetical protein